MTTTKKNKEFRQFNGEKEVSRIKDTRAYILKNNLTGLMNNHKWREIFEWLEKNQIKFTLTSLLSSTELNCTFIRELEDDCLLIDDSGQFIFFLEINTIILPKSNPTKSFLEEMDIVYLEIDETFSVIGYR